MRDVRDYVVLITGATSGIGLSMAKVFAQRGNTLIITASDQQRLNITKRALQKAYHVSVEAICQDLSEPDAARKLYQKIKEKKYMVNILVNNAGFGLVGSEKDLKLELSKNACGQYYSTDAVVSFIFERYELSKRRENPECGIDRRFSARTVYSGIFCKQIVCSKF